MSRTAVVLFNLGGPDSLAAVRPFLFNLFSDAAIIALPAPLRHALAWIIAKRRTRVAEDIYRRMGGASPLLQETRAQAAALEQALGSEVKAFIAMRYWHPLTAEAMAQVKAWQPERVVLLPLYPQFSYATTLSSLKEWNRLYRPAGNPPRQGAKKGGNHGKESKEGGKRKQAVLPVYGRPRGLQPFRPPASAFRLPPSALRLL